MKEEKPAALIITNKVIIILIVLILICGVIIVKNIKTYNNNILKLGKEEISQIKNNNETNNIVINEIETNTINDINNNEEQVVENIIVDNNNEKTIQKEKKIGNDAIKNNENTKVEEKKEENNNAQDIIAEQLNTENVIGQPEEEIKEEVKEEAKKEQYKLYNFGYQGCYYCTLMEPIFNKYSGTYSNIRFISVDIYASTENWNMFKNYGLSYTPSFVMVNSSGKTVETRVGYMDDNSFKSFVEKYI